MLFDLSGKVALVAGGAGYLGQAICLALAEQGAVVMVADLARERAEALAADIAARGGKGHAVELDVADEASSQAAVARTVADCGRLDVLVNAACFSVGKSLDDLSAEEFDRANRVNLTGAFLLAREAARVMPPGSSVILFASMYGLVAPDPRVYQPPMTPNPIEYGVGKAGVIQMAKYLAVSWGERGIRVNAIAPGPFPNSAVQQQHPEFVQRLAGKVPLGRIGRQDEIAGTVVFLAADASSYLNGATLSVDGGWTAW
ncbi:MAG: SDR family oxidoreductase [Kiritimatiellae bacterium]|nr:SDR family oxidoreductase [Verrucomicrobiota bacterium]MBU4367135.1 SDR family oxidoreductase [Verrucomicrobiota bacterium]MCG2659622.1 SDR family oxidoreductase [Kiritimatiellia bacterium]